MRRKEYQYQRDLTVNVGSVYGRIQTNFGRSNFGKGEGEIGIGVLKDVFAVFFSVNISKLIPKLPTKGGRG